ncbi:cytochrome c-type biogenesis protein [Polycyclovorans algicola]|uniref:cytochrome c-type biogenesis protein n=1 Tax=Polycyclovorans algicola TaxID=616992 RepID=UPI0004A71C16|nr:cytochrome c-type biogenesis protein [Polycyclovorans algicola]
MRTVLSFLVMVMLASVCAANPVIEVEETERQRYQNLLHELRCVVCQNQSISESNAPLAKDLREQVASQINQGRSDADIRGYLTDRYGDFVLYKPPLKGTTVALWVGPFVLLAVALLAAWRLTTRKTKAALKSSDAPSVDRAAVQVLLDRHGEGGP